MKNQEMISYLKELGVKQLKTKYTLLERPLQQKFKELKVNGMGFNIKHYEIIGVGNLSVMDCDTPFFQMLTFIITPYYKDIPMLSSDFVLKGNKHDVITEIYSLVTDKNDATYKEYIKKFEENMASCKLTDNEVKPDWCDVWRPCFANKTGTDEDDDSIINLFKRNIEILMEFEQSKPFIEDIDKRVSKFNVTKEYVDKLIENGGVSTNMFKATLGVDATKEFFYTLLFGNDCFKLVY